jgi:pyridoxamine 5'-phosphate oxidase
MALACAQSREVASREVLERRLQEAAARHPGLDIPVPETVVGYILRPVEIEFWQGRPNRLHDRLLYRRGSDGRWTIERLSP